MLNPSMLISHIQNLEIRSQIFWPILIKFLWGVLQKSLTNPSNTENTGEIFETVILVMGKDILVS